MGPKAANFFASMSRRAGKAKTRKGVAKRFKTTGTGKILRRMKGGRHIMRTKNAKRRRRLKQSTLAAGTVVSQIRANLPFG